MNKSLRNLQYDFQAYLLTQDLTIVTDLSSPKGRATKVRLKIYRDAYLSRLLEALKQDYPAVAKGLGDVAFNALATAYVNAQPSTHPSLREVGENLPDFVRAHAPTPSEFWYELALFEKTLRNSHDAINETASTFFDLQRIPPSLWSGMTFRCEASVQLLTLQWNTPFAWKILSGAKKNPLHPKQYQRARSWLIWRQHFDVYFLPLNATEAWALNALQQQLPFAELCQGLNSWIAQKHSLTHAALLLKQWLDKGFITHIQTHLDS